MGYSNFKDPFGLLKRMLLSKNKIAYSILVREALAKLLIPLDQLLKISEKKRLKKTKSISELPIILIIGGSRSGTTLLYQTLVHYLPVSYVSNFIAAFKHSPITAYKLFNSLVPKSKKTFESYFGSVAGQGGPNDAFDLWNRWLGQDRNHIPKEISSASKSEMKNFFNAWLGVSKKPFLNKNNRNSLCAPLLASIFKNIYFVEIYRDPIFVAQSLLLSRRTIQGDSNIGWGLLSKDSVKSEDPLHYIDDICQQVYQVDKVLAQGRKKIDPKKYIRVSYQNFCENPKETIQKIGFEAMNHKINSKNLANLRFSTNANQQRLKDDEFKKICDCIEKLYGTNSVTKDIVY